MIRNIVKIKDKEETEDSVQKFVNVIDIKSKFLYTRDKYIFQYIQIPSIDINLFSEREKRNKSNVLTAEFSSVDNEFKFIAISRPVDISPLLSEYQSIYSETSDLKQKELLRHEMASISNFALSGEIVERQFYIMIWEKYEEGIEIDINKRAMEFISRFESADIKANIITEKEIIRLCNLVNNPSTVNLETISIEPTLPFISQ